MTKATPFIWIFLFCSLIIGHPSASDAFNPSKGEGRGGRGGGGGGGGGGKNLFTRTPKFSKEQMQKSGLISTGLRPIYPEEANCRQVVSFFGDRTRYDGSLRNENSNYGYHGGMDISAPIGTPIIAVADGTVVQVAFGGQLVGNKITIQHAPADTGLPVWTYSKYQHFDSLPRFSPGDLVKMGQVLGPAGNTGTTGGHYGYEGYPHLHMNIYAGDGDEYSIVEGHVLKPKNMKNVDPLAIYFGKELDSHKIAALPDAEKRFTVPHKDSNGKIVPAGTRVVWPFVCEAK